MEKKRKRRASFTRMAPKPLTPASPAPLHSTLPVQGFQPLPGSLRPLHLPGLGVYPLSSWCKEMVPRRVPSEEGRHPLGPLHLALGSNLSFWLQESEPSSYVLGLRKF